MSVETVQQVTLSIPPESIAPITKHLENLMAEHMERQFETIEAQRRQLAECFKERDNALQVIAGLNGVLTAQHALTDTDKVSICKKVIADVLAKTADEVHAAEPQSLTSASTVSE